MRGGGGGRHNIVRAALESEYLVKVTRTTVEEIWMTIPAINENHAKDVALCIVEDKELGVTATPSDIKLTVEAKKVVDDIQQ